MLPGTIHNLKHLLSRLTTFKSLGKLHYTSQPILWKQKVTVSKCFEDLYVASLPMSETDILLCSRENIGEEETLKNKRQIDF